jgi:DNA mismatch endonuclease (patch repair protein)
MVDRLTAERRSYLMSRVHSRDTTPERIVRNLAHRLGYRFRLHRRDLPGCPDLVFPFRRAIIFVHGCFWHHHEGCRKASIPGTRTDFWLHKFARNVERDAVAQSELERRGWRVLTVWQCETRDNEELRARLIRFLDQIAGANLPVSRVPRANASPRPSTA